MKVLQSFFSLRFSFGLWLIDIQKKMVKKYKAFSLEDIQYI